VPKTTLSEGGDGRKRISRSPGLELLAEPIPRGKRAYRNRAGVGPIVDQVRQRTGPLATCGEGKGISKQDILRADKVVPPEMKT